VVVPIRTISASNVREHWAVRAKRVNKERFAALCMMQGTAKAEDVNRIALLSRFPVIRLTRVTGPRGRTLDDDNLRGCLKAIRDGVADSLSINDNDPRVSWYYAQRKGAVWVVEVEVFA
jgi:hypothetical protein